jgi:hypothetical protein
MLSAYTDEIVHMLASGFSISRRLRLAWPSPRMQRFHRHPGRDQDYASDQFRGLGLRARKAARPDLYGDHDRRNSSDEVTMIASAEE